MIPEFIKSGVLPPYIFDSEDEDLNGKLSPYTCSSLKLCKRFGTTENRINILKKLLLFRKKMHKENIRIGFQWLYGSFVENIEVSQKREPKDLDIITFYRGFSESGIQELKKTFPEYLSPKSSLKKYNLDHSAFIMDISPEFTVELLMNSMQLCTHTRKGEWKGILRLEINTPEEDETALNYLENVKNQL